MQQTNMTEKSGILGKIGESPVSPINEQNDNFVGDLITAHNLTEGITAGELLNASMNSSPIGMYIVQDGKFEFISRKFADILSYSQDELKGRTALDYVQPEDRDMVKTNATLALRGKYCKPYEFRAKTKTDEVRWVLETVISINYRGKRATLGNLMDVTERKQAEEALKESEEFNSSLLDKSPNPIVVIHPDTAIKYVNPAFEKLTGFALAEIVGMKAPHPWWPKESKEETSASLKSSLESGGVRREMIYEKKNAERFCVELSAISIMKNGTLKYFLVNWLDITQRKRMEDELKSHKDHLEKLVQEFEKQNRLNSTLAEMRDLLQACSSTQEVAPIIMSSMKKLFPNAAGALFLMSPSRSDLESVARWGGFPEEVDDNVFAPDACWGLRRGHAHLVEDAEVGPVCPHLKHRPNAYVCLPLMAKGDILGLLHLSSEQSAPGTDKQQIITGLKDMAITISEYLSLAIANVKLSESLSRQSIQDSLSGLYNRRYMEESLEREIQRAVRKHTEIGIIMADLDYFKRFNDTYGHAAGDMVIANVGKLFKQGIRGSDIACRYGGEEFVLILPDCSMTETLKKADELRQEVKKLEIMFQGQIMASITVSMGVVIYDKDGKTVDELLRTADISLYKAKQAGRDRMVMTS
jgi:diguanylate cyclase (GGDEF)-like protein/PAS domain S-box-containing protein